MAPFIVHITTRSAWELARSSGRYDPPSLAVEGFIHFSDVEQVVAVANAAFSGQDDLVLLCVAVDRLEAPLRYESSDAGGESFPHVYGALNLDAAKPSSSTNRARRRLCYDADQRAATQHARR